MPVSAKRMTPAVPRSKFRLKFTVIMVACALSAAVLTPLPIMIEQSLGLSLLFKLRGPRLPPDDIVIVSINEVAGKALELSGNTSAWPRDVYAGLIARLDQLQARMIVMDIAFREIRDSRNDAALAEAIERSGKVLLFKYLQRQQLQAGDMMIDVQEVIPPLPIFERYALGAGAFALPRHPAHVVYAPLFLELAEGLEPSQPMMAFILQKERAELERLWSDRLHQEDELSRSPIELTQQFRRVANGNDVIAGHVIDKQDRRFLQLLGSPGEIAINYYGPSGTIPTLPIDQVLGVESQSIADSISNKIVYIGYSTEAQTEQKDAYRTVFTNRFGVDLSGVEISASVLGNLLDQSHLRILSHWKLLLVIAGWIVLIILCWQLQPTGNFALQGTALVAYLAIAVLGFNEYYYWWPVITPLIACLCANGILLMFSFLNKSARVEQISLALLQYLPADAARKLGNNFTDLEKQHQLVAGVCLLTDIRGYTRLSETLPPCELHQLMNNYYAELVRIVNAEQGIIGNIVGDSMLALWTGPEMKSEMCHSALRAALNIQRCIADHSVFSDALPTCTGLHGGTFSLGHLGAKGHFEYSPVGDIINTTARVEHFNRTLQTDILISKDVADHLAADAGVVGTLMDLGSFDLRNKSQAVNLYTLCDNPALKEQFELALQEYRQGRPKDADNCWRDLIARYNHGPSRYYHARIRNSL